MKSSQAGLEEGWLQCSGWVSMVFHASSCIRTMLTLLLISQVIDRLKWKFWAQTKQKAHTKPSVSSHHNRNWLEFTFLNMQNGIFRHQNAPADPSCHGASIVSTKPSSCLLSCFHLSSSALTRCLKYMVILFCLYFLLPDVLALVGWGEISVPTVFSDFLSGTSLWTVPNLNRKASKTSHSL